MAAAGVDASNVGGEDVVLVLPRDADALAAQIVRMCSVCWPALSPTPWLSSSPTPPAGPGAGCHGLRARLRRHPPTDRPPRRASTPTAVNSVTVRCPVDEPAAAADLVKGKASGIPAALVTGLPASWFDADAAGAGTVVRTGPGDWFALGHVEAVRAALGSPGHGALLHHRDPFGRRPRPLVCSRAPGARAGAR